jgi:hypothetical protein
MSGQQHKPELIPTSRQLDEITAPYKAQIRELEKQVALLQQQLLTRETSSESSYTQPD